MIDPHDPVDERDSTMITFDFREHFSERRVVKAEDGTGILWQTRLCTTNEDGTVECQEWFTVGHFLYHGNKAPVEKRNSRCKAFKQFFF